MAQELSAADIRKLLNEKFPPTNQRERVYVSVTLALLDEQEALEAQVTGLAELFGLLCAALEINPRELLALKRAPKEDVVGEEAGGGGVGGAAGAGGAGGAGGGAAAGGGGAGPGPANPINDKTPFPAGAAASAPPGTGQRVTTQASKPQQQPQQQPQGAAVEDLTPNAQSGPPVNARPNVVPPANGAPKSAS